MAGAAVPVLLAAVLHGEWQHRPLSGHAIGGPYAALLAAATDLGAAGDVPAEVTAALHTSGEPRRLVAWARRAGVSVRWRTGDSWAVLTGSADRIAAAFGVPVRNYRNGAGEVFYASPRQPVVPPPLRTEVSGLGRILSYTPHHGASPWPMPREVPDQGLSPDALLRAYNATVLQRNGGNGRRATVVVFAFDGFDQADLDMYSKAYGLPLFTPDVVGGMPPGRRGEATMDLEAIHAVAPEAKTVLVNALPTVDGGGTYPKIAAMMDDAQRRYPGAVWSLSIGWGCDRLVTAADLAPVRSALAAAERNGTSAFDASGDFAGLECKVGRDWAAPPGPDDVGLDAVASLPEMTSVGGTTLSTDANGEWLAERAWFDPALSHGSGGGVSALFDRPSWQQVDPPTAATQGRLTPDVAAVADQFTGLKIVFGQQFALGGGTSLAAPIWAGLTALLDDFLLSNGARLIGDFNPKLYRIAARSNNPPFRDIVEGGNAIWPAQPGYDLVTGLGTPNADNLLKDLFVTQRLNS